MELDFARHLDAIAHATRGWLARQVIASEMTDSLLPRAVPGVEKGELLADGFLGDFQAGSEFSHWRRPLLLQKHQDGPADVRKVFIVHKESPVSESAFIKPNAVMIHQFSAQPAQGAPTVGELH